jgi:hypothetical protein
MSSDYPFRVDLLGPGSSEPEKIGLVFDRATTSENGDFGVAAVDLTPEDALELAARISDVYGLHKRWLDAREHDPLAYVPEPLRSTEVVGLDVEGWRLRVLLKAGYPLRDAERLARDTSIDLHQAEDLARDAGPETAMRILS